MARIKIKDLANDAAITEEDMRRLKGGPTRRMEDFGGGIQVDPVFFHKNVLNLGGLAVDPYLKING